MIQESNFIVQEGINHELLNNARMTQKMTVEDLAKASKVPEGTVKNIVFGKTKNPQICNLVPICRALNVPLEDVLNDSDVEKKAIEEKGIKEGNVSVLALKEIYEQQQRETKEINEQHIANIRAHYEQHHQDLKENYEKRLADKRELIDSANKQIKDLCKANFIKNIIISLFVIGVVFLFVLELITLNTAG
ncbi:MAG: helix-turn-helix transcriptional regulator [Paludibacteraceae bacterium]|nr:helix-turn-helix transcriptional regulator [Paludibacteraceae bacterium]